MDHSRHYVGFNESSRDLHEGWTINYAGDYFAFKKVSTDITQLARNADVVWLVDYIIKGVKLTPFMCSITKHTQSYHTSWPHFGHLFITSLS